MLAQQTYFLEILTNIFDRVWTKPTPLFMMEIQRVCEDHNVVPAPLYGKMGVVFALLARRDRLRHAVWATRTISIHYNILFNTYMEKLITGSDPTTSVISITEICERCFGFYCTKNHFQLYLIQSLFCNIFLKKCWAVAREIKNVMTKQQKNSMNKNQRLTRFPARYIMHVENEKDYV